MEQGETKKRKLPQWMLDCAMAKKSKSDKKKQSKNFIHILNNHKLVRIRKITRIAIDILSLTREQRALTYGESLSEPFQLFDNCAVMCVLDLVDVIEVLIEVMGCKRLLDYDGFNDEKRLLKDLENFLSIYEIHLISVIQYLE
jgi:hypothetical protein